MSKTNCINCGAAKDTSEIKCPFCGTTYLDMTAIDFSSDDPVVCQFVLPDYVHPGMSGKMVMSMLARPHLDAITQTADTVDVYGGFGGSPICQFTVGCNIDIGVSFSPIAHGSKSTLFELKTKE